MEWVYDDGGREEAILAGHGDEIGFDRFASDCVCRSISIATQRPYIEVHRLLVEQAKRERRKAEKGYFSEVIDRVMQVLGWERHHCVRFGQDKGVRLRDGGKLPMGRVVVSVFNHCTAVVDGVVYDTYNSSDPTKGSGIVYSYWTEKRKRAT